MADVPSRLIGSQERLEPYTYLADSVLFGRVYAFQHFIEVAGDAVIALACQRTKSFNVPDADMSTRCFDDRAMLQILDDPTEIAAPHTEHCGELFLRQRHLGGSGSLNRGQEPLRSALLDRMGGIAGYGLEDLCH